MESQEVNAPCGSKEGRKKYAKDIKRSPPEGGHDTTADG